MGENIVFGNGLIEACEAEKNEAKHPRVILTDDVIQIINKNKDNAIYCKYICNDNGRFFLNYLAFSRYEKEGRICFPYLSEHKQNVEEMLKKYRESEKILPKYINVAEYHNFFCENIGKGLGDKYKINIPEKPPQLNSKMILR